MLSTCSCVKCPTWFRQLRLDKLDKLNLNLSVCLQNFAAQMAGGFDEKAGGAQMGVMQGPMVSAVYSGFVLQEQCMSLFLGCRVHLS